MGQLIFREQIRRMLNWDGNLYGNAALQPMKGLAKSRVWSVQRVVVSFFLHQTEKCGGHLRVYVIVRRIPGSAKVLS